MKIPEKKLGFGLMRLPKKDEEIILSETIDMVDEFISSGFTYFDTAYVYAGSEDILKNEGDPVSIETDTADQESQAGTPVRQIAKKKKMPQQSVGGKHALLSGVFFCHGVSRGYFKPQLAQSVDN